MDKKILQGIVVNVVDVSDANKIRWLCKDARKRLLCKDAKETFKEDHFKETQIQQQDKFYHSLYIILVLLDYWLKVYNILYIMM